MCLKSAKYGGACSPGHERIYTRISDVLHLTLRYLTDRDAASFRCELAVRVGGETTNGRALQTLEL